jgi:hypothetical protein
MPKCNHIVRLEAEGVDNYVFGWATAGKVLI